jgi:ubiquinol-cytochrome c reductase cytochrome b subunit
MKPLLDWMDQRTGYRKLVNEALYENVPGGARWRYVWGSALTFGIFIQFVTGIFLWMAYSPSSHSAWESVYYIQNEMYLGWLLRGLHHYTAHVMIVLLVLHLMQVVIDGAYKAPREVNFWFGLGLLFLTLALALTGYLLPWDQKGFWATKVTVNIIGIIPVIGPGLQKILIGGTEYGHLTLTRFFALHAGILPALLIALLGVHIYLFRRHGLTAKEPKKKPDVPFWPDQVLKDVVASLAVLAAVLFLILRHWPEIKGAPLGPPVDPAEAYAAPRPEWYFLFLFQFLKYFPGELELLGAIIIPGLAMFVIFLMPFIGRWKVGHWFNVGLLFAILAGAGMLTYLALAQDRSDEYYKAAVRQSEQNARRVVELARSPTGIPPIGAVTLLQNDPFTQGPLLFQRNCASCHRYDGHDGTGMLVTDPGSPQSAPDLAGFATRQWLTDFHDPDQIASIRFLGGTKFSDGKMVRFIKREIPRYDEEQKEELRKAIIALSAEAQLKSQREIDARDADLIAEGRELLAGEIGCIDCHVFHKPDPNATAPDLTGYGSREWIMGIISDPEHPRFYGETNDRMPRFGVSQTLTQREIELLTDWLRGEWYVPGEYGASR